jgi:hypothetical protein
LELPLLRRVQEDGDVFRLTNATTVAAMDHAEPVSACGVAGENRLPRAPGPGEQYRFHFDMTKCIGCKCCVVACNEQNGNPADILWRRVGEIEGGKYPDTHRHYRFRAGVGSRRLCARFLLGVRQGQSCPFCREELGAVRSSPEPRRYLAALFPL